MVVCCLPLVSKRWFEFVFGERKFRDPLSTSILPPFYLFLTSIFNLCFVTSLEPWFANHGLHFTDSWASTDHAKSTLADCVNSSPPLISRKFQGFGGIWANLGKFGKFRENSGELSGIQWGLYGAWYEFSGNSWGISGQRRIFGEIWGLGWFRVIWGVKRLLRKPCEIDVVTKSKSCTKTP